MDKAEESALTEGGEVTMYLLTRLLSIASSNESVIQQILQAGVGLMFNGQPPGEAKSSVCGRTWGPGAMAYRCSDCQMNSSSCICVDCFKHGNHEGHDYRLYSSGYGGCCDCGDPAAWKPKGFCSKHSASSTESTAEQNFNPEVTKVFLDHVLGLLHTRMVSYLKQEENVAGIGLILTFISKVCSFGDAPRRVMAEAMLSFGNADDILKAPDRPSVLEHHISDFTKLLKGRVMAGPASLLDVLVMACAEVRDQVHEQITKVFMDLNYDSGFKEEFAGRFFYYYPAFIAYSYLPAKVNAVHVVLSTVTAQMLSFPGFVTRLAREHGLFDMLLKCLTDFFDQFSTLTDGSDTTQPSAGGGDGEPMETETEAGNEAATSGEETEAGSGGQGNIKRRQRKLIDLTQRVLRAEKSPWERVIGDLDMALDHRSTSALFIFGLPGAFTTWQHILAMLHGMNVNKRQVGHHVEYELDDWRTSFYLDMRLLDLIAALGRDVALTVQTALTSAHKTSTGDEGEASVAMTEFEAGGVRWPQIHAVVRDQVRYLLDLVCSDGVEWQTTAFKALYYPPDAKHELRSIRWSPERDGVSFHIPLHRNLMAFVHSVASASATNAFLQDSVSVADLLGVHDKEGALLLLEHPLKCHLLLAQIDAGMWRRNGEHTMSGQSRWYRSSSLFGRGSRGDLLAMQCAVVLLGAEDFVATLVQRFGLLDFFELRRSVGEAPAAAEGSYDPQQASALAEGFFRLVLEVVTNRAMISTEHALRKQIIQWLAAGQQMTHSKLIKQITYEKIAKKEAEQILAEVAVFVRPQAGKQGYFQLKPEYWNEFDPYFLHFTQADLNLATENYHVAIKGKGLLPIATPSVPYAMFADVDDILRSPLVHSLIYTVLHHTATSAKSSKYSESVLDGALHLLMLCLRRETTDRADACARDVSVDVREDESNPCSALKHPGSSGSSSADVSTTAGPFSLLDRLKLKVRSGDVGGNQGEEGEEATSMLELLIKLRKASEQQDRPLAEEKPFLDELLRVVRVMDDECTRVIDASFEDASRESKAKTARERARERIMAQMKRQQQAFIDKSQTQELKMDTEEAEGGEEEGGTTGEVAPSVYPGHPTAECVLCRETKPWDEQPLGLIGACKRSRLLSLANQQPVRLENWRRTFLEVIERQKGKDAGSKGKDKEVAEPLSPSDEQPVAPPEPLGVHITVKELKELMELLRGFLEESPLMVSINRLEGFTDNPRLLDMLLDAYAREVQAGNSQPITDDYVQRHAHEHHHEAVRSPASPSAAGPSLSSSPSSASAEPVSPLLYADFEQTSVLMQSCGHTIHFDCWKGYLEARATSRRNYGSHEDMLLSEIFQEFWCPQCRRLSNVLIPLVPSSIAPPSPLQPATEPPLGQESYERWLFQFLGEEEDEYELEQDEAMFSGGEDEDEEWAWDENESEGEENEDEEDEDAARMERLEGLLGHDTSSDSDLDDMPSLEDSSDSDLEFNEAAAAPGHAHPQEEEQQQEEMDDVDGHADGNGNGEEMNQDEQEEEESRIDGGGGDGREEEEVEEEGGGGGGEYEFGEVEGGEGEEEELMADEAARAEALARESRNKQRADRAKMRALTSRFTRHIYAVKKYRHKPSPSLKHREQPLYLLANLSYSIAELELSIRGSGPVADHDQQSTAEEVEEQRSVMRRFSCLSERRYAHFKDVYELVKASLADQRRSDLRRWRRLVRATIRGSSHEVGAKPLLSTELFPLLVTWISLEQAHAASSPPIWNSASDSDSPSTSASSSSAWAAPFVHVALTAAVTQVLLSLLSYRPEPMASRRERRSTPESWEDEMEEEEREAAAEPSDDDIACLLRYLRACADVQGKNESESEDEEENEDQDQEKPRRRGMAARLPSLDVLDGRGEGDRRVAAEQALASHDAPVRFVKAHTVPLLRRTALFLATCHHLPLAGLLALEEERGGLLGAKDSEKTKNEDGDELLSAEFDVLAAFLGLPPLESLLFGGNLDPMWQLVQGWWRHQSAVDRQTSPPAAGSIPCIASPVPFKLIELPHLFQDVFLAYLDKKCSKCNTQPSKPAICLICGSLLCAEGDCCKQTRCGECFRHAIMCGGGVGLFLLAKTSGVLLIAEDKSCLWGSPYFDQYGEEDVLLKRGANLFLDRSVYGHLNQLLVEHQLESEILRADVPPFKKAQPARKW